MADNEFFPWVNPGEYDFTNKELYIHQHVNQRLTMLQKFVKINGLPDYVPQNMIKYILQTHGHCICMPVDGRLYWLWGHFAGYPNAYRIPKDYVLANPYLNISGTFEIGTDCVLCKNDSLYRGLLPILQKYGTLEAEAMITLYDTLVLMRDQKGIIASNDNERKSAEAYLSKLRKGDIGVMTGTDMMGGIKTLAGSMASTLTDQIELIQYIRACEYNELGIDANYNMKRESLTTSESDMNTASLHPFVDDMLDCWKQWSEEVSDKYDKYLPNGPISIEFDSAWKTEKIQQEQIENPDESTETEGAENE